MGNLWQWAGLVASLGGLSVVSVVHGQGNDAITVTLGTATAGGGFPAYGDALIRALHSADSTLHIEPRNTKGSTENIPALEAGSLDLALVQGEAAFEALNGVGRPPANLRILSAMYATAGMFVVRADSSTRSIGDLVGKPVAFGARGSGLVILSRYVLDGLGLAQDKDFGAIYLDRAGDGPAMVLDGRAAALWGGGAGWPGFQTMAASPGGARFIAPDAEGIRCILAKHPFLRPVTLPARSFPGQPDDIPSVGSWSFVMTRPTLPDDVAYRLARALRGGQAALARLHAQGKESALANVVAAAPKPELIHPGVAKYLRETGVLTR